MTTTAFSLEELAWFKLSNYDGLKTATASTWAWAIHDRAKLKQLYEQAVPMPTSVADIFAPLQQNPLQGLGFDMGGIKGNALDTATVKMLTIDRFHRLSHRLKDIEVGTEEGGRPVDELLPTGTFEEGDFVHLFIDPHTTKAKLLKDFKDFLNNWFETFGTNIPNGKYDHEKLGGWHALRVIPYFDLRFFATIHGRRIAPRTYADLLQLGSVEPGASGKIALDNLAKRVWKVINFDCFRTVLTFADRDPDQTSTAGILFSPR